jgi:DNA-3-methyladenine glycosylase II
VRYVRDLSTRIHEGTLDLAALGELADEEVITSLTQVKGVGRWTAEMFLMFRLHRPDVLPVGDLGIVKAAQRVYRLRKPPSPERLTRLGEPWRPYRSVACWYLWASLA